MAEKPLRYSGPIPGVTDRTRAYKMERPSGTATAPLVRAPPSGGDIPARCATFAALRRGRWNPVYDSK